ncbi:hypothetical protein GWN42_14470, partial [candidate division KSB1 bacterium]|nr:hypothetical protein [candidate division KSB1 bacterium]NIS27098.1 hypothetical protein [candidate division KSB1 bacterium]NIU27842.1 hypothetical protein [candidate division KSB1 bacterium]NIV93956.1 hypothetical protein [candidate division KSB1 bacterium]NIW21783.1 hypothetical protein [candidate division KSB1 bacterium]
GTFKPYILGVEDVVHISVVNKPSLNTEQAVRPDGKISFYPMGDMPAAGLTVEELRKNIIQGLKTEMKKPYV